MSVAQVWAKGGVWSAHPKMGSRIQRGSPLTLTPLRPRYPPQAGPPGHSASSQPRHASAYAVALLLRLIFDT